jgi:hypothetical protein
MINREWQEATVTTLSGTLAYIDEYGQPTAVPPSGGEPRIIKVYKKIYTQTNVSDPRYVDVDEIALTEAKDITPEDILTVDGQDYNVKYVVPSARYTQLLLHKKA